MRLFYFHDFFRTLFSLLFIAFHMKMNIGSTLFKLCSLQQFLIIVIVTVNYSRNHISCAFLSLIVEKREIYVIIEHAENISSEHFSYKFWMEWNDVFFSSLHLKPYFFPFFLLFSISRWSWTSEILIKSFFCC